MRVTSCPIQKSPAVYFKMIIGGYINEWVADRVEEHRTLLERKLVVNLKNLKNL